MEGLCTPLDVWKHGFRDVFPRTFPGAPLRAWIQEADYAHCGVTSLECGGGGKGTSAEQCKLGNIPPRVCRGRERV